MKKFEKSDVLINTLKAHPKVKILGYNGKLYLNSTAELVERLNNFLQIDAITGAILTEEGLFLFTEGDEYILVEI